MRRSIAVVMLLACSASADDPELRRLAAKLESKDAEIRLLEEQIDRLSRLVRLLKYPLPDDRVRLGSGAAMGLIGGGGIIRRAVEGRILGVSSQGLIRVDLGEASGLKPGDRLSVASGTTDGTIRIIRVDARDAIGEYQTSDGSPLPAVSAPVRWLRRVGDQ